MSTKIDLSQMTPDENGSYKFKTVGGETAFIVSDKGPSEYPLVGFVEILPMSWTLEGLESRLIANSNRNLVVPKKWKLGREVNGFGPLLSWQKWHLEELWTEDMLEGGYRPLVVGESPVLKDEAKFISGKDSFWPQDWVSDKLEDDLLWRTKRPLPDPHKHLREALSAGKTIQFCWKPENPSWTDQSLSSLDANVVSFSYSPEHYRVKPEPPAPKYSFKDDLIGKKIVNDRVRHLIVSQDQNGVVAGAYDRITLRYEDLHGYNIE